MVDRQMFRKDFHATALRVNLMQIRDSRLTNGKGLR